MSKVIRSVTAKFNADISDFQKQMNTMSKNLKKSGEEWKKAGESMTKAITVPLVAAATAMVALTVKAGKYGDEMANAALTTGMSVKQLQELRYVASQVGMEYETLVGSFGKFTRTLATANNEKSEAAQLFKALSVNIKNADGSMKPINETFFDTMKALSGVKNETMQAEVASILFGKSYQDLLPLMKTSAEQIDLLKQRANELGLIFTPEQIKQLEEFNNKINEIRQRFEYAGNELAIRFLPVMDKLIGILEDNVFPAIVKVIDKVSEWIDKFVEMDPKQQDMILGAIALAAALGPVAVAIGNITVALATLASAGGASLVTISGYFAVLAAGIWATVEAQKKWSEVFGQPYSEAIHENVGGMSFSLPNNSTTNPVAAHGGYQYASPPTGYTSSMSTFSTGTKTGLGDATARAAVESTKRAAERANGLIAGSLSKVVSTVKATTNAVGSADDALAAYFNSLGNSVPKAAKAATTAVDTFKESIISMVNAVKEQTKAFFSLGNAFDVVDTKVVSGDRLFIRLQKRIKDMMNWKSNLAILEGRGVSKENMNELRGMGPSAGGEIAGLAQMSSSKLKEYFAGITKIQGIAGGESSKFVSDSEKIGTKIDKQINIYATGVKGDANAIADSIVKKLRVAGYRI